MRVQQLNNHALFSVYYLALTNTVLVVGLLYGLTIVKIEHIPDHYHILAMICSLLVLGTHILGHSHTLLSIKNSLQRMLQVAKQWGYALTILLSLAFITKTTTLYSREVFVYLGLGGYLVQCLNLILFRSILPYFHLKGYGISNVLVVGHAEETANVLNRFQGEAWRGMQVVGYVPIREPSQPVSSSINPLSALPCLGKIADLPEIIKTHQINEVFLTVGSNSQASLVDLMGMLLPTYVNVHWVPDLSHFHLVNPHITEIGGQPLLCLSQPPINGIARFCKWLMDIGLASCILLLIWPLLALIALGIKLSSTGPVLFVQTRMGKAGKTFSVYKFRTMHLHQEQSGTITQASKKDPRITPIGRWLRSSSLDELPQLFNVLKREMSLVGPRPHAIEHDNYYGNQIGTYMLRHHIKPGITGWAQINGYRGETKTLQQMQHRVEYDLYYLRNWSLLFDCFILLMTGWVVFKKQNAF